jgi:uncharacterized protein YdhG (YjbR/CyaY superfamily)
VSAKDIDKVFATYSKEQRATLEIVRQRILEVIPEAQQCIKYGIPTFTINGKGVAGLAGNKKSCSYYPWAGLKKYSRDCKVESDSGCITFSKRQATFKSADKEID